MQFSADTWVALAAGLISVCALGVTVWQGLQNHKHNVLSVRPFLSALMHYETSGDVKKVGFEIINSGIGPAIIKNFILLDKGEEVSRNDRKMYEDYITKRLRDVDILEIFTYAPDAIMQAGERLTLLLFNQNIKKHPIHIMDELNLVIEYECIYRNQTFVFDSRKARSQI